jgi:hypothetical protein
MGFCFDEEQSEREKHTKGVNKERKAWSHFDFQRAFFSGIRGKLVQFIACKTMALTIYVIRGHASEFIKRNYLCPVLITAKHYALPSNSFTPLTVKCHILTRRNSFLLPRPHNSNTPYNIRKIPRWHNHARRIWTCCYYIRVILIAPLPHSSRCSLCGRPLINLLVYITWIQTSLVTYREIRPLDF